MKHKNVVKSDDSDTLTKLSVHGIDYHDAWRVLEKVLPVDDNGEMIRREVVISRGSQSYTSLYRSAGNVIGIFLYDTTIAWLYPNSDIRLNMTDIDGDDWNTVTTRRRLNCLLKNITIFNENHEPHVWNYTHNTIAKFHDGMIIANAGGMFHGKPPKMISKTGDSTKALK